MCFNNDEIFDYELAKYHTSRTSVFCEYYKLLCPKAPIPFAFVCLSCALFLIPQTAYLLQQNLIFVLLMEFVSFNIQNGYF